MYCPKCGTKSSSEQRFCRSCGANLRVIGKAVALGEVIGRSDRGPMLKIKENVNSQHQIAGTVDDFTPAEQPLSVTEHTTAMLDQKIPVARQ